VGTGVLLITRPAVITTSTPNSLPALGRAGQVGVKVGSRVGVAVGIDVGSAVNVGAGVSGNSGVTVGRRVGVIVTAFDG